jgi:hypothetical protein
MWHTEGLKSSPASGTVLADSGQLPVGSRSASMWLSANIACTVVFEYRNDTNSANVMSQIFHLSAVSPVVIPLLTGYINVAVDERFRVVTSGLALGQIQASLFVS